VAANLVFSKFLAKLAINVTAYSVFSRPSFSSINRTLSSTTSALVLVWSATVLTTVDLMQLNDDSTAGGKSVSANLVAWVKTWNTNLQKGPH
jgi:hypothetical protein